MTKPEQPITAFAHIIKTGGTTVLTLLRRNFGLRHLDVASSRLGEDYTYEEMARDLRIYPFVHSISGHHLRPYLDYGQFEHRLVWFTWLRKPVDRLLSGYQHSVEKGGNRLTFEEWLKHPRRRNTHVRMLAGGEDLKWAQEVLRKKIRCFGLLERFDESLLLLRHFMPWEHFNVVYGKPRNTAKKGEVRQKIVNEFETYHDEVLELTRLDQKLYDYAVRELYPKQVVAYGESRLEQDLRTAFLPRKETLHEAVREGGNNAFRKLIYKPFVKIAGF